MNKYNPNDDYCNEAINTQSVKFAEEIKDEHPDWSSDKINEKRCQTAYSCEDNYHMGTIQDDRIYIATTDPQHDQIVKGECVDANGGLSGYFSDQATIDACKNENGVLDNAKYNEVNQISPWRENGIDGTGDAVYKPHIDCLEIDRDKLYENYGTHDFNVAIAKCEENNQFGYGGGNQGYNPYIPEMIENSSLKYNEQGGYSDKSISISENLNGNSMNNSVVPEDKVDKMYSNALIRSQDAVEHNTPHPSPEACNNGFNRDNAIKLDSETGHAIPVRSEQNTNVVGENNVSSSNIEAFNGGGARAPDNSIGSGISDLEAAKQADNEFMNNQINLNSSQANRENCPDFSPNKDNAISM